MKQLIIIVLFCLFVIFLYLMYSGLFLKPFIDEHYIEKFPVAFIRKKGDYKNAGKVMDEVYFRLKDKGILTEKGFGLYFDNPNDVKKDDRNYFAGVVLTDEQYKKYKQVDSNIETAIVYPGDSVVARFVYRTRISVFLAVIKVYPAIEKYIKDNNLSTGAIIELYDMDEKNILFICSKKDFFVNFLNE